MSHNSNKQQHLSTAWSPPATCCFHTRRDHAEVASTAKPHCRIGTVPNK